MAAIVGGFGVGGSATPWVLAPGSGINTGTIYETLQALSAAADTVQPEGLIDVWLDATANGDVYTATTDNGLTNIQRIRLTGAGGHGTIRPSFSIPPGVSFDAFGETIGVAFSGAGGRMVIPNEGRLLADVCSFEVTGGSQAVVQQLTGFGATFFKGCEVGALSAADDCVLVASGAMLVGQWIGGNVRQNAISNTAGAGNFQVEMFSCNVSPTQTLLTIQPNAQPGPISAAFPQSHPFPFGHIRGFVPSITTVGVTGTIASGEARDQTNAVNIIKSSSTAFNLATVGAGGRDYAGALTNGKHSFYMIYGPNLAVSVIASQDHVTPTLSGGYTGYVFIGYGIVGGGGTTLTIYDMVGDGRYVEQIYNSSLGTVVANTETTFSLLSFLDYANGRTQTCWVTVENTAVVGSIGARVLSGVSYTPNTIGGYPARIPGPLPLRSINIYGFSSLAGTVGVLRLNSWNLIRGAK